MALPEPQYFEQNDADPRLLAPFQPEPDRPSALGAFGRSAARATAPTAAGVAAFPAGAAAGAGLVAPIAPFAGPFAPVVEGVGAIGGGLATSFGAGYAVEKAQNWLFDQLSPATQKALGIDPQTQAADQLYHPRASFLGSVAPQALFMRPGWNGWVASGGAAAIAGGVEAGTEYADTGRIDPFKVTVQAALGATLGKNTKLGDRVQAPAEALVRSIPMGHGRTVAGMAADETLRGVPDDMPDDFLPPDAVAARRVRESEGLVRASNPFKPGLTGDAAHAARLAEATVAASDGRPPDFRRFVAPADAMAGVRAAIARFESGGNYSAANPQPGQTAFGKYQFIDSTWKSLGRQIHPGATDAEIMAMRRDPAAQERFMTRALSNYQRTYRAAGIEPTPGDLYLMHALGPKAVKIARAAPETPIAELVTAKEMAANPTWLKGTAEDVRAEFARRTGDVDGPLLADGRVPADDFVEIDTPPVLLSEADVPPRAPVRDVLDGIEIGPFGPIHRDVAGDWQEAVTRLAAAQAGEVPAALSHPEIGPIDVIWGNDKGGLAHIIAKHPEVVEDLPAMLPAMEVVRRTDNRVQLESPDHHATVRLTYDDEAKSWLLTAFRRDDAGEMSPTLAEDGRASDGGQDGSPALGEGADIANAALRGNDGTLDEGPSPSDMHLPPVMRPRDMPEDPAAGSGSLPDQVPPAETLADFDTPSSPGVDRQVEGIEHDLRMAIEADPKMTVRLDEEGNVATVADLLDEFDRDARAIEALRACLKPGGQNVA